MNILFFYRVYPNYGGVEVVTTVLANRFIKDGHGVIIASIEQPHIELACQLLPDVKLVKLDYPVCSIKNMRKLHRLIINEKIDIIINQWGLPFMSTLLCRVAIKRTSCKLISVLHGAPNTSKLIIKARDKCETVYNPFLKYIYHAIMYLKEELVKASIRYNCSHCEKYVLLSSHFIKPLSDYAHIKRTENIIAIGNPVTIPVYFEEWELKQKKKQLLYVGRMDYENKRVNRIVEAWKVLYEKYVDWELVLVGEGPYKSTLEEYIRRYDIQRVCFKGFQVSPPIQHYKEASIFLLTSDLEGFGLVVIESMSYGVVPVVYGSYEAIYDIIDNGKSGLITPIPYNSQKTIDCISLLIENEKLRKEMAKEAMCKAKCFTIDSEQFDGIFADGSLLVSAIRLVYGKRVTRRSFDMTSLAPELLNYLMESRKTLYIVASGQEQVECSVRIFQEQYPELRIAGFRNGYFSSDAEMNKEASHIVELNPDFLIVGMGALMQEKFLLKVKKMGYQGIGFTCGGFVHQTAMNRMHYYPNWVDKMNLRFVYRMYKEKHTRTRYLQAAFLFPVRFIGERIFG